MRISSSYFIMASLMPQIKCWGCFAWQYHFMLILDGTENEVVISLCHAATISLTILSAAFYEDVAVTAGCRNQQIFLVFLSQRVYRFVCSFLREKQPLECTPCSTQGLAQRTQWRTNLQIRSKTNPIFNEFDLCFCGKRNPLTQLQA